MQNLELQDGFIFTINGRLNIVIVRKDKNLGKEIFEVGMDEMGIHLASYTGSRKITHNCPQEYQEACHVAFYQESIIANMTDEERESYYKNYLAA